MNRSQSSWKIHRDEVKERQTTHWDLDYLPAAEFEALMSEERDQRLTAARNRRRTRLVVGVGIGAVALLGVGALVSLLGSP